MNVDSEFENHSEDSEPALAPELAAAIERIKSRQPTQDSVERLLASVAANRVETQLQVTAQPTLRVWIHPVAWVAATAAAILLILGVDWTVRFLSPPVPIRDLSTDVRHSPIRRVSFVDVGLDAVLQDLNDADASLAEVSQSIELAALRQDIQEVLDECLLWFE